MRLGELAHARTGDKGDTSQICVFVHHQADYPRLLRLLTAPRVSAQLCGLSVERVEIYPLPGLGAVNLVLHGALSGGVTRSLALDAHGKTLGMQLLDMEIGEDDNA
ncbi:hypothetical protein GTZ99_14670 [Novosphingobium sp. FSY-8]|uniref:AtuA-like ferredoxin-fold domain-containing protein n=1 Tax=Novosphingobium ovatum TaxID=1908523 RepID=A0ABW9XH28_9SPHN|nr:hypothetical protein [Novosphingobium ovatum]NBC37796.1 hypothetical protein [Novosphingobium ovatum]